MVCRRGSDAGQSRRRWIRSSRGCPQALQEEFFFRLSCIGKRTREGSDNGNEVGTDHTGETRKGQPLWGNRRNSAKERVERVCLILAITGASGLGTWTKASTAPVNESVSPPPGSPVRPGTHWMPTNYKGGEGVREVLNIPEGNCWRNSVALERRKRADRESVRKSANWKWHVFRKNVSPPARLQKLLAASSWWCSPAAVLSGGPKWRGNFSGVSDHLVNPNL